MGVLYNGTAATNGFNANGHYVRAAAILGSCTGYARTPVPICSANFSHSANAAVDTALATSSAARRPAGQSSFDTQAGAVTEIVKRALHEAGPAPSPSLTGLLSFLTGGSR